MSHKKKKVRRTKRVPTKPSSATPPAFAVGALVRVKAGTRDPDFPDMPLGGWAGTITQVGPAKVGNTYLVEWNSYTLLHMHPVFRARCEREGLEIESSWLEEAELEPDGGGVVQMEQPATLSAKPLDPKRVDDRIRAVFHLTTDDPLPPLNEANLRHFYEHLAANIALPISVTNAELELNGPPDLQRLTLVELVPPHAGEVKGELFAEVTAGDSRAVVPLSHLEPQRDDGSARLLRDYAYWIWERSDHSPVFVQQNVPKEDTEPLSPRRVVFNAVSRCGLYGAAAGAAVGAVSATMDHVLFAMGVGALVLAVVGYIVGTRYGFFFGKVNRINSGPVLGGILGVVGGAVLGVVAGALVIAYFGTIIGSIVGTIVGYLLQLLSRRLPGRFVCGAVGTVVGAVIAAWYVDADGTLLGLLWGTTAGACGGLALAAAFFGLLIWLAKTPEEQG